MRAKLTVVRGKATKDALSLKLPTVIGRSPEADLTVAHRTISRRHAELFEAAGTVMIRDLGSLNGVLIDGQRVKEAPLPSGTEFTIGPLTFRVEYAPSSEHSKPPSAVVDKPAVADNSSTESLAELPDFEALDEDLAEAAPVPEKAAAKDEKQEEVQRPSGDPFEDLLNELE
jgi:pSer/pThr/pTyr-binding forkhead associated (FHA) protein